MKKRSFLIIILPIYLYAFVPIHGERQNWGEIEFNKITEASGLIASSKNKDVFWTHNDSGGENKIYAFNPTGKHLGSYLLKNCVARDWEDIAIGPGPNLNENYIYVGDIGDNKSIFYKKFIYRCKEPIVELSSKNKDFVIDDCEKIIFQYEDGNRDAETLMIDPLSKDIIIMSKREENIHIYKLPYPQKIDKNNKALLIGSKDFYPNISNDELEMITAGEISRDGKNIILKSYIDVFYFKRDKKQSILEALNNEPYLMNYIPEVQGEAICFQPHGFGFFTISEENLNIESTLYFYPKLFGCIDSNATNYNPYAEIGDRSCIY